MASASRRRSTWSGNSGIADTTDVARVLGAVNAAVQQRSGTAAMAQAVQAAGDPDLVDAGVFRVLPVVEEIAGALLPWPGGLRRGSTVAAVGSNSLIMALLAEAMAAGSWAAVCGLPTFGALAAGADYGLDLSRLALVPDPGSRWTVAVAALLDGVDLVVVHAPTVTPGEARSLSARARQRGSVLITTTPWPGSDLTMEVVDRRWSGLGQGHGRLRRQEVTLRAVGRGQAARPRQVDVTMPPPSTAARTGAVKRGAADEPVQLRAVPAMTDVSMAPLPGPDGMWAVEAQPVPEPVDPWTVLEQQVAPPTRRRR
jgi:hypothetical protein